MQLYLKRTEYGMEWIQLGLETSSYEYGNELSVVIKVENFFTNSVTVTFSKKSLFREVNQQCSPLSNIV